MTSRINKDQTDENDPRLSTANNIYEQLGGNLYKLYKQILHDVKGQEIILR